MLVSSSGAKQAVPRGVNGFTLLELLIVLVVISMTATIVAPDLWRTYTKARERDVLQQMVKALDRLRADSRRAGRVIRLSTSGQEQPFPTLPKGWRLDHAASLYFLPNGATNGGIIHLRAPTDRHWRIRLAPLDGRATIEQS